METNSRCGFHPWIPNLELSSRFLYSVNNCVGRAELIDVDADSDKDRQAPIDEIFVIAFAYDATTGNGYSHTIEVLRLTVYII
jgi:hypothetical protein